MVAHEEREEDYDDLRQGRMRRRELDLHLVLYKKETQRKRKGNANANTNAFATTCCVALYEQRFSLIASLPRILLSLQCMLGAY